MGDRLVVQVGIWNLANATAAGVRDSAGNQYVELLHFAASDGTDMSVWTAPITAGGGTRPTITVTPTSAANTGVAVLEYSGLSTASVPGFDTSLTVIAVQGTAGVGAVAGESAGDGGPHVTLTTTKPNSLIFGVGNDWDSATARTPGLDQVILDQWLDRRTENTFWSQNTALPDSPRGSRIVLHDTGSATEQWNLVAVEVLVDDG